MRTRSLALASIVAAVSLAAAPAQASDSPEIGGYGVTIPGTGCTVYTPWILVQTSPTIKVEIGPPRVVCPRD
jgi:hypothetical protein